MILESKNAVLTGTVLALFSGWSHAQTKYDVVDLGVLPGYIQSNAFGVNNAGHVVGDSYSVATNTRHAIRWEEGTGLIDLGTLPGGRNASARAIANSGAITGHSDTSPDGFSSYTYAFLHTGSMAALTTVPLRTTRAHDVNELDMVVGTGLFSFFVASNSAVWVGGVAIDLGGLIPEEGGEAFGINDLGWVVGKATTFDGFGYWHHAFVHNGSTMLDLGTFAGPSGFSTAFDINEQLEVVGQAENRPASEVHAFHWRNGIMTSLGFLPNGTLSTAKALNEHGYIVGSGNTSDINWHAIVWQNGTLYDLNDLVRPRTHGWLLTTAEDISNTGFIVGQGYPPGSQQLHGYRLEPRIPRRRTPRTPTPR